MSLLLLFGGAKKGAAPACTPAFQIGAFQNSAFQTCVTSTSTPAACTPAFQIGVFQNSAFQTCVTATTKTVGWMPEWGFRHDPEDLERRLKAQRESAFNPKWLDRFIAAEAKARTRIGKVKTAAHRAALEEAVEQVGARVGEAIDAGSSAPEELIVALEAAAAATRAAASLKHALRAIEMAHAILMEEEDIEILLLH